MGLSRVSSFDEKSQIFAETDYCCVEGSSGRGALDWQIRDVFKFVRNKRLSMSSIGEMIS
jgi:hypothetical protein